MIIITRTNTQSEEHEKLHKFKYSKQIELNLQLN